MAHDYARSSLERQADQILSGASALATTATDAPVSTSKNRRFRNTSGYYGPAVIASGLMPNVDHELGLAGMPLRSNRFCRTFMSGRYWAGTSDLLLVRQAGLRQFGFARHNLA